MLQGLRYGARTLMKTPGFTLIAVITLALGIGANSAIFSVVNSVLLRELPYREPQRLVMVWSDRPQLQARTGMSEFPVSAADFTDWRDQNQGFEQIAAFHSQSLNITGGGEPEFLGGVRASANLFALLGVEARHGRVFLPEEDQPGNNRVVVLSDGLWQRRFGSDPKIIGQTISLNNESYTVIGAGLLLRSFMRLMSVDPGLDPQSVLTMNVLLPRSKYGPPQQAAFFQQLLERLRALPGVKSVGAVYPLPLSGAEEGTGFGIEGQPPAAPGEQRIAGPRWVSPDYFKALRIQLLKGRVFNEGDGGDTPPVLVINEAMARQYWPNEDPIGRRVSFNSRDNQPIWREIVGVVKDVRHTALDTEPRPQMYFPFTQFPSALMTLVAAGVAIGLAAAFALTRLISTLLFGVRATDPVTFVVIALLLTVVALLACYIPARRATKVDPMEALRYE